MERTFPATLKSNRIASGIFIAVPRNAVEIREYIPQDVCTKFKALVVAAQTKHHLLKALLNLLLSDMPAMGLRHFQLKARLNCTRDLTTTLSRKQQLLRYVGKRRYSTQKAG